MKPGEKMMMMWWWWWCLLFVLAETKNRSRAPYKPWGRYVIEKKKIPCTLPTKIKRYSGSIIWFIGCSRVIVYVIVIVCVTGDRAGEVFLVCHEEGCDWSRLVPFGAGEAG
jgi:hypothetical protein